MFSLLILKDRLLFLATAWKLLQTSSVSSVNMTSSLHSLASCSIWWNPNLKIGFLVANNVFWDTISESINRFAVLLGVSNDNSSNSLVFAFSFGRLLVRPCGLVLFLFLLTLLGLLFLFLSGPWVLGLLFLRRSLAALSCP